jgi:hypothetical protein
MLIRDPCLSTEQHRLRDLISDVSESCLYAGWAGDAEFHVWRLATEGGNWGHCSATEVRERLVDAIGLAHALGQWIVWSEKDGCDNGPVDLTDWKHRYAVWMSAGASEARFE